MLLSTTGKIKRIFPTITNKGRDGNVVLSRKFWIDAPGSMFGIKRPYATVEMNVINRADKLNTNFATTDDLDRLEPGRVVRFMFQIKPIMSVDRRTGEERCYTNLFVASRIELMGANTPYSKAKKDAYIQRQNEQRKVEEEALKDYAEGGVK